MTANIFAPLAKKVTKKIEKEELGQDPLAQHRMVGLTKLTAMEVRPEVMAELVRRAKG